MQWDKVEVKTEQVVDENPRVWLNAAVEDYNFGRFEEAIEKLHTGRDFLNNQRSSLNFSEFKEISGAMCAREIFSLYKLNNQFGARELSEQYKADLKAHLNENPEDAFYLAQYDLDYWLNVGEDAVRKCIKQREYSLLLDAIDNQELSVFDDKALARLANSNFAMNVVSDGQIELLKFLYSGGFDLKSCKDSSGNNLTMIAARNSCIEVLKFLIDNNINGIEEKNNSRETALLVAVKGDNINIYVVDLLIKAGADVNVKDSNNDTPLMLSVKNLCGGWDDSTIETTKILTDADAEINAKNKQGMTALILAARDSHVKQADILISAGANIFLNDNNGFDAFYYAADSEIIETLVRRGVNVDKNYSNDGGKTKLHKVASLEHWHDREKNQWLELLDLNADVSARDDSGNTPLMLALDHSWVFTAELDLPRALVKRGADVNARNKFGTSVQDILDQRHIKREKLFNTSSTFFFERWF